MILCTADSRMPEVFHSSHCTKRSSINKDSRDCVYYLITKQKLDKLQTGNGNPHQRNTEAIERYALHLQLPKPNKNKIFCGHDHYRI